MNDIYIYIYIYTHTHTHTHTHVYVVYRLYTCRVSKRGHWHSCPIGKNPLVMGVQQMWMLELFVAWWHCRTPPFHLPIISHRHRLYVRSNILAVRIWDLRYSEHKDRRGKGITKNWYRLTCVRKAGGGLQLRNLHVAFGLRSSYILMVRVIYFDMGMYIACYDVKHYVPGVTRSATKSSTMHVDIIRI